MVQRERIGGMRRWVGRLAVVRAFIEVGRRELDEKDGGGEPALINAACSGHLDIVKVLVRAGAGVDVANSDGCAPLHDCTRLRFLRSWPTSSPKAEPCTRELLMTRSAWSRCDGGCSAEV